MDHQPYENWLLDDERLTAEQERELRIHLRNCPQCAALARANLALRAAPMSAPPSGFLVRFQTKLVAERKAQRRRNIMGWTLLLLIGMGVVLLVATPYLAYFSTPMELAGGWMSNLIHAAATLRAMSLVGSSLFKVLGSLVPPYVWAFSVTLFGAGGFVWVSSFRRFGRMNPVAGQLEADE